MKKPITQSNARAYAVHHEVNGNCTAIRLGPVSLSIKGAPFTGASIESAGWYGNGEKVGPGYLAAIDTFESLVLSMFMSGVELSSASVLNALATTVDTLSERYAEDEPPTAVIRLEGGLLSDVYVPAGIDLSVECLDVDTGCLDQEDRETTAARDAEIRALVRQGHLHAVY